MITSSPREVSLPGTLGLPAREAGAEGTDALAEVKILAVSTSRAMGPMGHGGGAQAWTGSGGHR